MNNLIGLISCNYQLEQLSNMTKNRPIAAIPFGGRYNLLDFALSSMVNSGLKTVGIITPYFYRPILDNLGSGREWYLDRKAGGLFILPGSTYGIYSRNNKFSLKDLEKNIDFLIRDRAEYVILSGCNAVFNIDFKPIFTSHQEKKADITLAYKELQPESEEDEQGVILNTDLYGNVIKLENLHDKERVKYFADVIVISKKLLIDIIHGHKGFEEIDLLNVINDNIKSLKVVSYPIHGYFGRIYSNRSYYERNMELLTPSIQEELFLSENKIRTRIKDNPPTKYSFKVTVNDSFISSGCQIDGKITQSFIFRGVKIEPGSSISNSIIMQECYIGKGVVLQNVILDKSVHVTEKTVVIGKSGLPVFIDKSRII
ncbi:glucose-1-phosphate adenylyltransferase subunit GlgD [Dehalobacter sp. DCM]|uniref:glucose-1-phosphate adenylyltransferase subunit GlgD n=1 Tax=Dehalobacter sp. DCM TaxID=2907827 RepID=UPI0030815C68|nr:glucose-1-phosphate adenylyltransferase subunit GlgD [Dehalobacter sp. DCM]